MDSIISKFIFNNWQRKCGAIFGALLIWFFVNHSITTSKVIPHVPIRIVNIPEGKTVQGLLPNGILAKRAVLTVSGTKSVIEQLEPGDIEVHIDASNNPDEWIIQINKKNLVSLNPDIDLLHHIAQVSHNEFVVKMSRLVKAEIPVTINQPSGELPKGYQFLDVWPRQLHHTVFGPEEQVQALKGKGIELTFNLNEITKSDLDALQNTTPHQDEISYAVQSKWKQVKIPFLNNTIEEINDPEAQKLHINFLKQELIPIQAEIPVQIFYPSKTIFTINPNTFTLSANDIIQKKNGTYVLTLPLYTLDVSKVFLDIIRDHLQISITAASKEQHEALPWSIEFINSHELENRYVEAMNKSLSGKNGNVQVSQVSSREKHLRDRFREYMQKFSLYTKENEKLQLTGQLRGNQLILELHKKAAAA